jgi:hypothetical protein
MSRSEPPSLPIPLAPHEIPTVYDTRPTKAFDGKYGAIVAEPRNNRYGVHKVLNRADGLSVVLDTTASLGRTMPVFRHEADARGWAYAHRGAVADDDDDDDDDALLAEAGQGRVRAKVLEGPRREIDLSRTCRACGVKALDAVGRCGQCGWTRT